jgi:glyoxylase-like metal-dependent hydrolase (beta-lactamase superfamily II)
MKFCKEYNFNEIKGYKLGWSLLGPPLMTTYCFIIKDLMIDTGQSHMKKKVLEIAEDHEIKRVVLTHHHEDHSGNAAAIKQNCNATVYGHGLTREKMSAPFHILPYQKYVWGETTPIEIELLPKKIETFLGDMIPVHTPGHAKDHMAFFLKDAGVLFSGDLYLADKIKFFRSDEEIETQIASLKKILKLDFDTLLCSHYPKLKNGKIRIKSKLEFLEELNDNIIQLWEEGSSEKQIFKTLKLKEKYFTKYFCFGNVSMINGVRSVIRNCKTNN